MPEKQPTHAAFALRRESRAQSRWIEIGHARIETNADLHQVFLDRLPIGGFTGHIYLSPIGVRPPEPDAQPERPSD
jgi:hypothetical protein